MVKYTEIIEKAKSIKKNVKKEYKLGEYTSWGYYIAKAILNPRKDVKKLSIKRPEELKASSISRQIFKSSYMDLAKRYVEYVEKYGQTPATAKFITSTGKTYNIGYKPLIDMFSRILVYYDENKVYPRYADINSKAFQKPVESKGEVYDYFVEKTGIKPEYLDDVCDWVKNKVDYQFYFDDKKTNKEVINSRAGNCTDLLQFLVNMAEALGYEWKVIHTKCRLSGTGHVYGKFRKKGSGEWFVRDIACIADESRYSVWCNVDTGAGYLLAENPAWFLANLRR